MKLKDVIRLEKTVREYGKWSSGEIDRVAWPLKKKKLKFSPDWQWRVIVLDTDVGEFRVLLRLNVLLEQFYAVLAALSRDTVVVICSHDLHTSHSNWHCHVATTDIEKVLPGVWRDSDSFRFWPSYTGVCSEQFEVTAESAMTIATRLYRFPPPPQGDLFA